MKRLGVLQPIAVRYVEEDDHYRIIAGERRYQAARRAGLTEVPCWVRTPRDEEVLLHQVVENWQRKDLNPFELADSLASIRDVRSCSQKELAESVGKSAGEVSKLLSLLDLDPDVQKIAREDGAGRFSKRHLYALSRLDIEAQRRTIARIQRDELSAEEVEKYVSRRLDPRDDRRGPQYLRRRFVTSRASVLFTFRGENGDQDVLDALAEVRRQIREDAG